MTKEYPWKVKWTARSQKAIDFMPENPSIIDLGGGRGEICDLLLGKCDYTSIDLELWNEHTIKADLNKEFPELQPAQFALCLGTIEYIDSPENFLRNIKKYSSRLIISYREKSQGGMPRKNNLSFMEFELLMMNAGWSIICHRRIDALERIYFYKKND